MLRLTGLPAVARCPDATVFRVEEGLAIVFSGGEDTVRIDVERRFLGDADLEEVELRLLARLVEMGYRAARARVRPAPEPGAATPVPQRTMPCGSSTNFFAAPLSKSL